MKMMAVMALALGSVMLIGGTATAQVLSQTQPSGADLTSKHMAAQAMLTAHFIDAALQAGFSTDEINWILRMVAAQTVISEFWISDENGNIVYTNIPGTDFAFPTKESAGTQAAPFAALLGGMRAIVAQDAQPRDLDDAVFKYVGVAGVDQPRIVQVGIAAAELDRR